MIFLAIFLFCLHIIKKKGDKSVYVASCRIAEAQSTLPLPCYYVRDDVVSLKPPEAASANKSRLYFIRKPSSSFYIVQNLFYKIKGMTGFPATTRKRSFCGWQRLLAFCNNRSNRSKPLQTAPNLSKPHKFKSWFQLAFAVAVAGGCGRINFFFFF